jgi:uncharacterized protein with HEPN domain
LVRIRQDDPAVLTRLSDSEKIIGFRNILVHGYDAIDHKTVWSAIHDNLPILIEETETLLNE